MRIKIITLNGRGNQSKNVREYIWKSSIIVYLGTTAQIHSLIGRISVQNRNQKGADWTKPELYGMKSRKTNWVLKRDL